MTDAPSNLATVTDHDHLWWVEQCRVKLPVNSHVDLGCGGGGLGRLMVERGVRQSVGVDIIADTGGNTSASPNFRYLQLDLNGEEWPEAIKSALGANATDLITAFDILEHVDSPWTFLTTASRLLAPGGQLVLTTPNIMSWERVMKPTGWSGASDAQHKILFQPYSLRFLLERAGFETQTLRAPVRKLGPLGWRLPLGGQMIAVATLSRPVGLR